MDENLSKIISGFPSFGELKSAKVFGNGHINDTYLLTYENAEPGMDKVVLQKINKNVFHKPDEVMKNTVGITSFLRKKIIANGGDPERETINVIFANNGESYVVDDNGDYWREMKFISDATSYDAVEKIEDFYASALAFGMFQRQLSDYPADELFETIPGFHDTRARFARFRQVVKDDVAGRASGVQDEIKFILDREDLAKFSMDSLDNGKLPLRVTHNDTKLNNIMIDNATGKAICVIDLDTTMPGLVMNDFGDAIRFGASTAAEDETDLDKVSCDLRYYDIYTKGFLEGCGDSLTDYEKETLPMGAKGITYEQAIRFLTDYLEGDTYYKTEYPEHNLVRARTQIKLVKDMEDKWEEIQAINKKYI